MRKALLSTSVTLAIALLADGQAKLVTGLQATEAPPEAPPEETKQAGLGAVRARSLKPEDDDEDDAEDDDEDDDDEDGTVTEEIGSGILPGEWASLSMESGAAPRPRRSITGFAAGFLTATIAYVFWAGLGVEFAASLLTATAAFAARGSMSARQNPRPVLV